MSATPETRLIGKPVEIMILSTGCGLLIAIGGDAVALAVGGELGSSRVKQEALITFKIKNGVNKTSLTTHIKLNLLMTKYYHIY